MLLVEQFEVKSGSGRTLDVEVYGLTDYAQALDVMREFSSQRDESARDRIWLIEHPRVYTQGTACDQQTLLPSAIPIVKTDRGGQITYHGPGQIVMYPLINLRRFGIGVKSLVNSLEQSVIDTLGEFSITAQRRTDAPGVYVEQAKISALGLRLRRGNSYHGLSFNIDMDLSPFANIDPCGYQGLQVTQLCDLVSEIPLQGQIGRLLVDKFVANL
ncbi:MAG: lipoyl(octanoyl) transferase [Cryomorphaceae bacterium]|jgi:lipoyl(octanoyl) transferase